MSKLALGEKLDCQDAVYEKKNISTWVVELIGGIARGAIIRLWQKAKAGDVEKEAALPHIYQITPDGKYMLLDEIHFMHFLSALPEYKVIRDVTSLVDLAWRNK